MARAYIRIFFDWETKTAALTLEEQGRLLRGLLAYARGENPDLPGNEKFVFPVFQSQIDKDNEQYETILQRNQANGTKGGRPRKTQPNPDKATTTQQNPVGYIKTQPNPEKAKNKEMNNKYIYPPKSPTGGAGDLFSLFWSAYPRKTAKKNAERAWNKIDPDEALARQIVQAVERFRRDPSWLQDNGRYIPHPATFLNGRRWEDEPPEGQKPILTLVAESGDREHADLDHLYE